jgi:NitT/TauT family transport system ATP-binding protein
VDDADARFDGSAGGAAPRGPGRTPAFVAINGVEKRYTSRQGVEHVALRGVNLAIVQGEFFCLLGPSGCGKTTLLNMVAGFEQPTRGTITFDNSPIAGPSAERGVVFQGDDSLFNWLTALQNVEFGLRLRAVPRAARREKARHFLHLVGLSGQDHKHPHELSGGMKQRIQIARVLANEPKMLLMDEPFAALDAQTRHLMQEQLARIWNEAKVSVLFITHDIDEAVMLATRVGVMTAGPAATLKGLVDVDLRLERYRTDASFMAIYKQVYEMIRDEVLKAAASREAAA